MRIVDEGAGTPVVLVPGVQGRWEWMKPTVDALARTGHLGLITRPDEFARLVAGFAEGGVEDDRRRLVG